MSDADTAPKRILIVEDEALVALYTRELLEDAGYEVVGIAPTGLAALSMASVAPPYLALVDIRIPGGMDGIATAAQLRAQHGTGIIFVSGTLDAATLERTRPLEPHACLQKPVRPENLLATVARATGAPSLAA